MPLPFVYYKIYEDNVVADKILDDSIKLNVGRFHIDNTHNERW